jgi:hypothetical protein
LGADVNVELGNSATTQISLGQSSVRGLYGVASGAIRLAADGYGKSVPGVNWTNQTGLAAVTFNLSVSSTAWGASVFVTGQASGYAASSPDGVTWTFRDNKFAGQTANAITWNGSQFLAVGTSGRASTSPDGITWTDRPSLRGTAWGASFGNAISWNGSQFLIGGSFGVVIRGGRGRGGFIFF